MNKVLWILYFFFVMLCYDEMQIYKYINSNACYEYYIPYYIMMCDIYNLLINIFQIQLTYLLTYQTDVTYHPSS